MIAQELSMTRQHLTCLEHGFKCWAGICNQYQGPYLIYQNQLPGLMSLISNLKSQISNSPKATYEVRMIWRSACLEGGRRTGSADLRVVESSLVLRQGRSGKSTAASSVVRFQQHRRGLWTRLNQRTPAVHLYCSSLSGWSSFDAVCDRTDGRSRESEI